MDLEKYRRNVFQKAMVILLNRPALEFIGILSYGTKISLVSSDSYKNLNQRPSLAFTNGKDITLLAWEESTPKICSFIIFHEVWHILSFHPARCGTRDHVLWNLAVDHVTNRVGKEYIQRGILQEPEGIYFDEKVHKDHPEITAEDYYNLKLKEWPNYKVEIITIGADGKQSKGGQSDQGDQDKDNKGKGEGDQESKGGNGEMDGKQYAKVTDKRTKKSWIVPLDCNNPEEEQSEIEKRCNKLAQQGKLIWNSNTLSKGNIPGNIVQLLDEIFKIELPWNEVVEKAILYHAMNLSRRTWQQPDYYIRSHYLPGKMSGVDTQLAIFVVDTSGSISDNDLKTFMGIVCDSSNYFDKIAVIVHDHDIKKPEHWFDDRPDEQMVFDKVKKVMGRGGTSHAEVFARIQELYENELISVVSFLTDYESDVQSYYKQYEWFKEIPTIWILNSNHPVEFEEEFDYKTIYITEGN